MSTSPTIEGEGVSRHGLTPNRLRWCTRFVMLLLCAGLLLFGKDTVAQVIVLSLSPFVVLAGLLATRVVHWFSWLGLVVFAIIAWRQRWFCRWLCPTGFCADQASWLGRRCGRNRGRWPSLGQWFALLTLMGACVGYPLLLWLDPLALFSAPFTCAAAEQAGSSWWYLSGLVGILIFSLLWPNGWCGKLCPLGGLQDATHAIVGLTRPLFRSRKRAGGELWNVGTQRGIRRRTVLGAVFGVVWAMVALKVRASARGPLRPPGSIDEPRFTGLCMRCGNCSRACPTSIITQETGEHGVAGLLTPKVEFREDYCLESCNRCTLVCPSGAIQPVSLNDKISARMGVPTVNMDICLLGDDRECSICRNRCPFEAIQLKFSPEFYTLTPVVDFERCPGCGACQVACPTQPEKAIVVHVS